MKDAKLKSMFIIMLMMLLVSISVLAAFTITANYPSSVWVKSNSVSFNFTPSSDIATLPWCAIYTSPDSRTLTFKANYSNVVNGTPHVEGIAISDTSNATNTWNVSCHNNTNQIWTGAYFGADGTVPTVTINEPVSGSYSKNTDVNISYTPTDSSNLDACDFYFNLTGWNINQTNLTPTSGNTDRISLIEVPDAPYKFGVFCNDSAGNVVWSENRTFIVDTTFPTPIRFLTTNSQYSNDSTPDVIWNLTIDTNFLEYNFSVSNSTSMTYLIQNTLITNRTLNLTVVSNLVNDGTYYFQVGAIDYATNMINTSVLIYYLDTGTPTVTLNAPLNNSYLNDNTPDFNVTVINTNPDACILYLSNHSGSGVVINNTVRGVLNNTQINMTGKWALVDGTYKFNIECNDSVGTKINASASLLDLTIDTIAPTKPNITSTWGATNNTDKTPTLEWRVSTETNFGRYTAVAQNTSGSIAYQVNVTNRTINYVLMNLTADKTYNFSVIAYDLAGNSDSSVNTTAQTIYYVDPVCGTLNVGWNLCGATWITTKSLTIIGAETSANFVTVWNTSNHQWATCNYAVLSTGVNCNLLVGINDTYRHLENPSGVSVAKLNLSTSTLTAGTYFYKVSAVDASGRETAASQTNLNVTTDGDANATIVSWTAVANANTYRIYNSSSLNAQTTYFIVSNANVEFNHTGQVVNGSASPPTVSNAYITLQTISHTVWVYVNVSTEWRNRTWVATANSANITLTNFTNGWNIVAGTFRNGRTFGHLGSRLNSANVSMFSMPYNNGTSVPFVNKAPFNAMSVNSTLLSYGRGLWVFYNSTSPVVRMYDSGGW